jgi:spore coat polysaccharide biosynthesis predicted glycosyltransferase SpsG
MKRILFRADAAPNIGIGDLMSLINISKYFDDDIEKYFMIKNYQAAVDLVKKYAVQNCEILDLSMDIEQEIKLINNFIEKRKIDLVFFEITERKLSDYQTISSEVKKVAINFDGAIPNNLDLVIDWDVEANKYFDQMQFPQTKFLLGPKYVILPKEFYCNKIISIKDSTKKRIIVAMGGADEFDFTSKVVSSILGSKLDVELNIIVGSGYTHLENLNQILENSTMKYELKQNITNMLEEYLSCDIGIGAGGLTASEMVAIKISPILIATYEHQIARCVYFDKMGWAKYLGFREFDSEELINAIVDPIEISNKNIFDTKVIIDEIKKI